MVSGHTHAMAYIEDWLDNNREFTNFKMKGVDGSLEKAINSVNEHFDCVICGSPLTTPKQTSCGHVFCNLCLEKLCNSRFIPCPLCKARISTRGSARREDVEDLKIAVTKLCATFDLEFQSFLEDKENPEKENTSGSCEIIEERSKTKFNPSCNQEERMDLIDDWMRNKGKFPNLKMKDLDIPLDKTISILKELFNCEICRSPLDAPKQTFCGHLFCKDCLENLCKSSSVPCPLCSFKISTKGLKAREDVEEMNKLVLKLRGEFRQESQIFAEEEEKSVRKCNSVEIETVEDQFQQRPFVFCPTRLSRSQLQKLHEVSKLCNGTVSREFTSEVTHLVISLSSGRVPQTLKYLLAIAGRKWVVIFDWVEECFEKGKMVPEVDFETSNFKQCDPGVRLSRLSKTNLFEGFRFYFATANFKKTLGFTTEEVLTLMEALGADVIDSSENLTGQLLIVGSPKENETEYYYWLHTKKWITVTFEWIIECILDYKLQPISKNHLCIEVSQDDLQSANVPKSLQTIISRNPFYKSQTR